MHHFNERAFDTIRHNCPQLESLTLDRLFMNVSDGYFSDITRNITIQPYHSLKNLHFNE